MCLFLTGIHSLDFDVAPYLENPMSEVSFVDLDSDYIYEWVYLYLLLFLLLLILFINVYPPLPEVLFTISRGISLKELTRLALPKVWKYYCHVLLAFIFGIR